MSDTLEFTIPDGYELDKENSTGSKVVYKKKEVRKKRWRAEKRGVYFYIYDITQVCCVHDYHTIIDDGKYNSGNYFRTREEAEEVAAEFRAILNKRK